MYVTALSCLPGCGQVARHWGEAGWVGWGLAYCSRRVLPLAAVAPQCSLSLWCCCCLEGCIALFPTLPAGVGVWAWWGLRQAAVVRDVAAVAETLTERYWLPQAVPAVGVGAWSCSP